MKQMLNTEIVANSDKNVKLMIVTFLTYQTKKAKGNYIYR
jgi:hypothetical protein